jgi:hypothetical protein
MLIHNRMHNSACLDLIFSFFQLFLLLFSSRPYHIKYIYIFIYIYIYIHITKTLLDTHKRVIILFLFGKIYDI